ncbi:hypothetical protein N6H18_11360 [Reichenbachiella agarivorans]|uniref:Aldose 1-epimerase n=1 Tax=Reichenbachiella agarivorans TaxID=2979464 RepID=A0ABY6CKA9_9BACT|nr:hypothetical protein [Reichenbachiella agarivorans]UXP30948.1 hypothetical protein N6H18_11360 [Reichenbachiella agarivorans]
MYEVKNHPIGRFEAYRLINSSTGEYLEIVSGFGAGINDLVVKNGAGNLISIIDGYRTEDEIMQKHHSAFKGSKLSPFPNRLKAGKYQFEGQRYQMIINEISRNNNLHALLHCRPFEVIDVVEGETECKLFLGYDYLGTDQGYPFAYQLIIEVIYGKDGITIDTQIENTGTSNLPIGDGWHPYFQFDNGIGQVTLQMGAAKRVSSFGKKSVSKTHGYENGKDLANAELDDCFMITDDAQPFVISMKDPSTQLDIQLWQTGQYAYYQIYSPPSRKQLAVEPVTCPPNAFNTGEGLIVLKPSERTQLKCGIKVVKI